MKQILSILMSSLMIFSLFPVLSTKVIAKANETADLPEQAGVYDVPGHPKLKLRVFVYNPARQTFSGKPTPTPTPIPSPVCSDDTDSSYAPGLTGWYLSKDTIYQLNTASVPSSVGSNNFSAIALNSFNAWKLNTHLTLAFTEGSNTGTSKAALDGQNILTWGRTSGSALAITYTWYDRSSGTVTENDTIMNLKFPWAWSGGDNVCAVSGYYDAQDILTHELGHWVGLDDEYTSNFQNNTMFGYGSKNEVKKDTLTTGDIGAVNSRY